MPSASTVGNKKMKMKMKIKMKRRRKKRKKGQICRGRADLSGRSSEHGSDVVFYTHEKAFNVYTQNLVALEDEGNSINKPINESIMREGESVVGVCYVSGDSSMCSGDGEEDELSTGFWIC